MPLTSVTAPGSAGRPLEARWTRREPPVFRAREAHARSRGPQRRWRGAPERALVAHAGRTIRLDAAKLCRVTRRRPLFPRLEELSSGPGVPWTGSSPSTSRERRSPRRCVRESRTVTSTFVRVKGWRPPTTPVRVGVAIWRCHGATTDMRLQCGEPRCRVEK